MKSPTIKSIALRSLAVIVLTFGLFSAAAGQQATPTVNADAPDRYLTAGPPLADVAIARYPGLAVGDLDGDGDPDALATDFLGEAIYYNNGGGPNTGASFFREAAANYPGGLHIDTGANSTTRKPTNPHPDMVDYDLDGDLDLFIGAWNSGGIGTGISEKRVILYYQNNGYSYTFVQNNTISKIPTLIPGFEIRWMTVAVGDLNNDKLPDAVVSYFETTSGFLGYYKVSVFLNNANGTPSLMVPNPITTPPCLNGSYITKASPRLVDIDKDTLLDLFIGCEDGTVEYYENTGTSTSPVFTQRKGTANPLNPPGSASTLRGPDVGRDAVPAFSDMDGDRVLDAMVVNGAGQVAYFRNTGSRFAAKFTRQQGMPNPLGGLDTGSKNSLDYTGGSALAFGDLDSDSDQDAISGGYDGKLHLYFNSGTANSPVMSEPALQWGFPKTTPNIVNAVPRLVDIDDDNDLDLFVSFIPTQINGTPLTTSHVAYFENQGTITAPNFVNQPTHSMSDITLPENAILTFGDIDTDGDLDALVGSKNSTMKYFLNTGSHVTPVFEEKTGIDNPMNGVAIQFAAPSLVDVEGDGDLDCLIGEGRLYSDTGGAAQNGSFHYLRNDGTLAAPVFDAVSQFENPFSELNAGSFATPALIDLDGDGDLDLFSGSGFGTFMYSRNVGTRQVPAYRDYQFNPLSSIQPLEVDNPHLISLNLGDVDNDGDQDAFIGTEPIGDAPSEFIYYLNAGTTTEPVFRRQDSIVNPLNGVVSERTLLNVSFADTTHNDGILEAFVGGQDTISPFLKYFEYDTTNHIFIENPADNPFPFELDNVNDLLDYQLGPRVSFFDISGNNALDAYIMRGKVNKAGTTAYVVYYTENKESVSDPNYYYTDIEDWWLDSTNNQFYYANNNNAIETGMNGSFVDAQTVWVGNLAGEMYTMTPHLVDPNTHANYMARVNPQKDPFKNISLPGPTLPSAFDINSDSFVDAFIAATDGRIHFFRGTDTPPPVPNDIFLPVIKR